MAKRNLLTKKFMPAILLAGLSGLSITTSANGIDNCNNLLGDWNGKKSVTSNYYPKMGAKISDIKLHVTNNNGLKDFQGTMVSFNHTCTAVDCSELEEITDTFTLKCNGKQIELSGGLFDIKIMGRFISNNKIVFTGDAPGNSPHIEMTLQK